MLLYYIVKKNSVNKLDTNEHLVYFV